MAAAVAEQEALKVQAWLTKNGIESTADFAFWFTSFEEALQEAGRAVANAWEIARKTSEPGIAGLVRRIFEAERAGQVEATPVPSQSLRIKPTQAKRTLSAPVPGRRSGYEKEVQPSMAMDEGVTQKFMDMLLSVGQHRSDDPRARTNFRAIIRRLQMEGARCGWGDSPPMLICVSWRRTTLRCLLLLWIRQHLKQGATVDPELCNLQYQSASVDVNAKRSGSTWGKCWWLLWVSGSLPGSIVWLECTVVRFFVHQQLHLCSALHSGRSMRILRDCEQLTVVVFWIGVEGQIFSAGLKELLRPPQNLWSCTCRSNG